MVPATRRPLDEIEPIPENLLREPVDYLHADHFRQQVVYKLLEDLILEPQAPDTARQAAAVLAYIERDLFDHMADEEEDVFPRLLVRCPPADRIERIHRLLTEEHRRMIDLSETVIPGLRLLASGQPLTQPDLFLRDAAAFAEGQRRHLAWENDFVFPLAKQRLTESDLQEIGCSMAKRRGIPYPG